MSDGYQPVDVLRDAVMRARDSLRASLYRYELTGDHNHGAGPIKSGASCPGGDCTVARTRAAIAALDEIVGAKRTAMGGG